MCHGILEDRENNRLKAWMVLNVFRHAPFIVKKKGASCREHIKVSLSKKQLFRVAGIILILFLPIDMLYQKPFHMTLCANTQICSPIWQRQADGNWNNWFPNLVMIPSHPDFIVDQRYTKIRKNQGPQSWSTLTAINSCACFSSKHIHDQTKTGFKSLYIKQQLMFASAAFIIGCINFVSPTFTIQIQRL